ncbi:MAG: hypothetical protein E5V44_03010, partial [Mesorhizobium sp.]
MTIKDFARRVVRYVRRAVLSRRQQMQGVLGIEWEHRHLQALAELAGVFDPEWYLTAHKDVAMSGIDPFAHYMNHGWRERRKPANGIDIET